MDVKSCECNYFQQLYSFAKRLLSAHPDEFEWTTWFNVDHPGGRGDYEQLDAIRFYYRSRVCESPQAVEARTTNWIPAGNTGERVHVDPAVGFWCANDEQPAGRNCSNYAVRFLCLRGKRERERERKREGEEAERERRQGEREGGERGDRERERERKREGEEKEGIRKSKERRDNKRWR